MQISEAGTSLKMSFTLGKQESAQFFRHLILATPFDYSIEMELRVSPQGDCVDCHVSVQIDRRGASFLFRNQPVNDVEPASFLPPINYQAGLLVHQETKKPIFTAFQTHTLYWEEGSITDSSEDLLTWFERIQSIAAELNVTVSQF